MSISPPFVARLLSSVVSRLPHPLGIFPSFVLRRPREERSRGSSFLTFYRSYASPATTTTNNPLLLLLLHFLLLASFSASSLRILPSKAFCAMTSGNYEIYVERDTTHIFCHPAKILRSTGISSITCVRD